MIIQNWQPLIEGMLEAVWLVDAIEFRIMAANRAAETLLGVPRGSLINRLVVELAATPEDVCFWEDVAAGLSKNIFSESLLRKADNTIIHVERRVTYLQLGNETSLYMVAIRDQSRQRNIENELEKLIAELRATLESTADGILVADMEGSIRGYNQRFAELWNLPDELLTRRDDPAVYAWMQQCIVDSSHYAARLSVINRSPLLETNETLVLRSGKILERVTLPQYARGRPIGRVFSYRDITQKLADEARLHLAAKVFESSLDATFITDSEHRIIAINPSCARLTGYSQAEMIGHLPRDYFSEHCDAAFIEALLLQLDKEGFWQGELWNKRKNGHDYLCLVSLIRLQDENGVTIHTIGFFKDITETHAAQKRIEHLAFTDVLTGLPNRLLLAERIEQAISFATRNDGTFALLFLDLDHFKKINDSLGHQFGDHVLIEIAERLKDCLRQLDTAARLGGDEFVLLLHQVDARGAEISARRVLEILSKPFAIDGMNFTVTCSIGISLYPADGLNLDDLIKNADSAMYHVKGRGRSDFSFYQQHMNTGLLARITLDHAMRLALENDKFRLHYQPQVDLETGIIVGAEALIRWHDEEMGEVTPGQFIPIAEESGLIIAIGSWVMTQAIKQAALWHQQGKTLSVSVNVSALQFQQSNFVESVAAALSEFALPPNRLELELTESILILNAEGALKRLQSLAELGIKLAIDDFGTGYSSLSYLKRFPIHKLKIDRAFIMNLPGDASDVAIVTAIISLAHALKLRVIAEGVETEMQREFLLKAGCNEFQGYLCSKALAPDAFEQRFFGSAE